MNWESIETVVEHGIDQYALDEGYLLHRVQWFQNLPYGKIVQSCCDFVIENFVVFDGYKFEPSTNDSIHYQRQ